MKNFRFSSRRKFIWMVGMSSVMSAFGGFSRKSLAQTSGIRVLPQNTRLLLRDIKRANPNDPASLSRSRKVAPEELESAFENLNEAFLFNSSSGQLTRNPAIKLNSDEESVVRQIFAGYQRQVRAGEIKLRRGANNLFIPVSAEPEEKRKGVVTQISKDQIKAIEKTFEQQKTSNLSPLTSEFDTNSNSIGVDSYLLAQGCGWEWWKKRYWWGYRFSLNKTAVNWLTSGSASVSAILGAMGVTGVIAGAIGLLAGILKAISNENGVRIYVTWVGTAWALPKPTSSGGC